MNSLPWWSTTAFSLFLAIINTRKRKVNLTELSTNDSSILESWQIQVISPTEHLDVFLIHLMTSENKTNIFIVFAYLKRKSSHRIFSSSTTPTEGRIGSAFPSIFALDVCSNKPERKSKPKKLAWLTLVKHNDDVVCNQCEQHNMTCTCNGKVMQTSNTE